MTAAASTVIAAATTAAKGRTLLVYGGNGALGRSIISTFLLSKGSPLSSVPSGGGEAPSWSVISIDYSPNVEATANIILSARGPSTDPAAISTSSSLDSVRAMVASQLTTHLADLGPTSNSPGKVDVMVNVAGGWAGGGAGSPTFLAGVEEMVTKNVYSSCLMASLIPTFLKEGGLAAFTGAHAALAPTPGMIAYGISKAATHHLVSSLAAGGPSAGVPAGAVITAVLPITLDTPMNRKYMPTDSDYGTWTPPGDIARKILDWASSASSLSSEVNGHMFSVLTAESKTTFVPVSPTSSN